MSSKAKVALAVAAAFLLAGVLEIPVLRLPYLFLMSCPFSVHLAAVELCPSCFGRISVSQAYADASPEYQQLLQDVLLQGYLVLAAMAVLLALMGAMFAQRAWLKRKETTVADRPRP